MTVIGERTWIRRPKSDVLVGGIDRTRTTTTGIGREATIVPNFAAEHDAKVQHAGSCGRCLRRLPCRAEG